MILYSLITAALVFTSPAQSGLRVSAQVSSNNVVVGEAFSLQVTVENANDDVDIGLPRVPAGMQIVGTQDFSETQFSIPGGRRQIRRREYAIVATRPGRVQIPGIVVTVGRRSYRTNAIDLMVSGSAQPQPSLGSGNEDVWLKASMNPETVYVGQQSTLTVQAGFSDELRARLTRPPAFDTPSPTGFWVQDVPGGVSSQLRSVEGRVFEIQQLQRAYFALAPGRYAFAPARAIIDVREGFLFAPETREIRSGSPKLTVLPLPTAGQPKDFHGAVGNYTIRTIAVPDTVAVGEAAQVTIEIAGTGNIKAVPQPALPSLAGVEQFSPTEDADVGFDGAIARGVKHFQWVIIPQRTGRIEIPAISYSFFDPVARAYKTVHSDPVTLVAMPSGTSTDREGSGTALEDVSAESKHAPLGFVRSKGFLLGQLLPLMGLLAVFFWLRQKSKGQRAETPLEAIARLRKDTRSYDQFLRELEVLVRRCAGNPPSTDALRLIERIARQRFAPAAAEGVERESLLNEAEAICRRSS